MLSLIEPGDRFVPGELKKGVCAMTVQRHRAVIETDYHQFLIEAGPPRELIHGRYPELPLAIVAEDTISVKVGIKAGPVNIAVEVHDTPAVFDDTEWEDVAEGDLLATTDHAVHVLSFWNDEPEAPSIRNITETRQPPIPSPYLRPRQRHSLRRLSRR
ncbi:hypothetical protein [Rhodococcus aetherivorans]|uniref:hypothetical protein n=1 Tax=Rhodococcus aetherivorans TaxID=191292 RepID=UPI0029498515|nr:hypothetical protein [Rhodococcus aetherivorans]MDV6297404.1 hypothetical protein [Rhodococcus aetherivorans]